MLWNFYAKATALQIEMTCIKRGGAQLEFSPRTTVTLTALSRVRPWIGRHRQCLIPGELWDHQDSFQEKGKQIWKKLLQSGLRRHLQDFERMWKYPLFFLSTLVCQFYMMFVSLIFILNEVSSLILTVLLGYYWFYSICPYILPGILSKQQGTSHSFKDWQNKARAMSITRNKR